MKDISSKKWNKLNAELLEFSLRAMTKAGTTEKGFFRDVGWEGLRYLVKEQTTFILNKFS